MTTEQSSDVARLTVDRLHQWTNGETPGPCLVTIFPTNRCNLRCTICWQRWCEAERVEIPDERWLRLIDEAAEMGALEWNIVGGGEPMVRGDLVMKICERICAHRMEGSLHTNGTLLQRDYIERLIDMGLHRVAVSLDGPNEEINDRIRSKGSFAKATANLRLLKELRSKRRATCPHTSLVTTLTNLNYDKLDRMIELARDLGCDEGVILSGLIVQEDVCASFDLSKEQREALPEHLQRGMAAAKGLTNNFAAFLPEHRATLSRPEPSQGPTTTLGALASSRCFEPWLSLSITSDGRVGPCCAFWAEDADNIRDMSFKDVWFGTYMQRVRNQLITDDLPDYCHRCPYTIVLRTRALRERILWRQRQLEAQNQSRLTRGWRLMARTFGSVRKDGLAHTFRRAKQWLHVRRHS